MKFTAGELAGVVIVDPEVFRDSRGFFLESYHARKYAEAGLPPFVQDNHSRSTRGTLRGLHAQRRHPQGKLVRAVEGEILDVIVDARQGSATFSRWMGVVLSAESFRQIYVPPGCFHGFCVLSDFAQVEYKCTDYYDPGDEVGIIWNDPTLGIRWPVATPLLSKKDQAHPRFEAVVGQLPGS